MHLHTCTPAHLHTCTPAHLHTCHIQVYQRAVINPMINIESLWKDYCSFEQSINPMIAEKLTQVLFLLSPLLLVRWSLSTPAGEESRLYERQTSGQGIRAVHEVMYYCLVMSCV